MLLITIFLKIHLVLVVIDYAEDENSVLNTGEFELVHKHKIN